MRLTLHGKQKRRLMLVLVAGAALTGAAGLMLYALSEQIAFAPTPTELVENTHEPGTRIRLGGLVETGSVERGIDGAVSFAVTDTINRVRVAYVGILPDLFREGQGVVTEGVLRPDGTIKADTVLARHDENYMPKEVADALKASGTWVDGQPMPEALAVTAGAEEEPSGAQ